MHLVTDDNFNMILTEWVRDVSNDDCELNNIEE